MKNKKSKKKSKLQRLETKYKSTEQKITRKQKWEEKQLYGYFKRQTREISREHLDMANEGKP